MKSIDSAIFSIILIGLALNALSMQSSFAQDSLNQHVKNERVRLIRTYNHVIEAYEKELGIDINGIEELSSNQLDTSATNLYRFKSWIKKIDRKELYNKVTYNDDNFIFTKKYIKKIISEGDKLIELETDIDLFYNNKSKAKKSFPLKAIDSYCSVLEIGGGYNDLAIDVFKQNDGVDFYSSDIDKTMIELMGDYYQDKPYLEPKGNKFHAIHSTDKSTKMEDKKFDYIIMSATFHHFLFPNEMLESIKKSCGTGTQILVLEQFEPFFYFRWFENTYLLKSICSEVMGKKEVLSYFKKHGFSLKEEKRMSWDSRYFRFQLE